jgi:putative membrane protein
MDEAGEGRRAMAAGSDQPDLQTTSGSRARDHLANERTWLAWIRTTLNVTVLGLAVARFLPDRNARATAAGVLIFALGAAGVVYGTVRYRTVNRELEQGYFLTGSRGLVPVLASGILLAVLITALLLVI